VPACVRWGTDSHVLKAEWGDRLGEYFTRLDFAPMEGIGHFPHKENPERAAGEIRAFFERN
jgi:pimeloyl-ACP methyl ester carboxylesterase